VPERLLDRQFADVGGEEDAIISIAFRNKDLQSCGKYKRQCNDEEEIRSP
jgi:hypothetical protein